MSTAWDTEQEALMVEHLEAVLVLVRLALIAGYAAGRAMAESSGGGGESGPAARGSSAVQSLRRFGAGAYSSRTAGVAPGPPEAKSKRGLVDREVSP